MQAAGKPGPKILFELSQVETGRALQNLRYGLSPRAGTASTRPLPERDSGKPNIQGRERPRSESRPRAHPAPRGLLCVIFVVVRKILTIHYLEKL